MTTPRRAPHPAIVFGLIGLIVLIWAFNFIVGKVALRHFDPLTLASFRVVLAAALMLAVYAGGPRDRNYSRGDAWKFAQLGLLGVALNQVLFTVGLNYTTVSHSALIIGMGPIYVLLLAWAFALESVSWKKLLGMLLSFAGVAVLAAEHGFGEKSATLLGDLLTMTGSVAFAFYVVLGKQVACKYSSVEMNTFSYLAGAVLILPVAVRQAMRLEWRRVSWEGWAGLVYMAVLASALAYVIHFWTLRYMSASRLVAFTYLLPVLATILGIVMLGEELTAHLVVGGALVLVGVYVIEVAPEMDRTADENQQTG